MKKFKYSLLEQEEQDEEENERIEEIIAFMRDESFTNLSKRLQFASKLLELITLSNDVRVRRLVKKIGDYIKEMESEGE